MEESKSRDPRTLEDVMLSAARYGVEFSPEDIEAAQRVSDVRRRQLEEESNQQSKDAITAFIEQFTRVYPRVLQAIIGAGEVLITFVQTLLIAFGVPFVLCLLLIVEEQRVFHGIALFEVNQLLGHLSASALVILNLLLELLISYIEHRAGWTEPPKSVFSFHIVRSWWSYFLGDTDGWQPRKKSPALRFRGVLRIVTFSILGLALAGSMQSVIVRTTGNWLSALLYVVTQSSLLEAATWIGGLLFAVAAVRSAQALSQYVAVKVVEIVAIMQSRIEDKPRRIAETAGLAGAAALLARLKEVQRQRRTGATQTAAEMPSVNVGGAIPVAPPVTDDSEDSGDVTPGRTDVPKTKIEQAVDILENHPDRRRLRKMSTRNLEAEFEGVGRNTWSDAKRRLGIKS